MSIYAHCRSVLYSYILDNIVSQKVSKPFIQFIIKLVLEDSIIFIIEFALCMYYSGTVDAR